MIRIIEREKTTLPMQCAACGFHLAESAREFCDECGHNKVYEIDCPLCRQPNLKLGIIGFGDIKCVYCLELMPNPIELTSIKGARVLYHLKEEIHGKTIH